MNPYKSILVSLQKVYKKCTNEYSQESINLISLQKFPTSVQICVICNQPSQCIGNILQNIQEHILAQPGEGRITGRGGNVQKAEGVN
jgi:ribosomal protein S3